jgi:septal ring factor EnvC (AmiA/AmiB activator)
MGRLIQCAALCLLGWVFVHDLPLDAATVNQKDLEGIRKKIEKERRGVNQLRKKEGSTRQALGQIENNLAKKSKELKSTNAQLSSIQDEMQQKELDLQQLGLTLDRRRELLRKRAVLLYRWQRAGSPHLLLVDDARLAVLPQRKHYLEATVAFDREVIQKISDAVVDRENSKRALAREKADLNQQRRNLESMQNSVRKDAEKKKQLLASLQKETDSRLRSLKELEQAALRLQKMIDEMSRRAVVKAPELPAGRGLEALKGKLEWPVKGQVSGSFGKSKHPEFAAEVFRKGIDIVAPIGEEIKAVENGRVVFAERFSGYGKMVIIDHGNRYFSVYAHLSEILTKTGDVVKRGQALGRVGDNDSLAGAGLYFEMRKDGKSIDPLPWFRK